MDKSLLDDLEEKRRLGKAMGGPEKLQAHAAAGRLNARERLDVLLDPGSFVEISVLARSQLPELHARTPADGLVCGYGTINGRIVYVTSEDRTVQAGTRGRVAEKKTNRIRTLALKHGAPYITLMEAGAGRFQEISGAIAADVGYRFLEHFQMSGKVPQCAVFLGACFGGPSFTAMQSDFVSIVRDNGYIGMSGPPLVRVGLGREVTMEEIGGAVKSARETGQADYLADDERSALQSVRDFLSYFPSNADEAPPSAAPEPAPVDSEEGRERIAALVSENGRKPYKGDELVSLLVDGGKLFPYRASYGRSLFTGWGRINGEVVGFVASNPMVLGGALDDKAAIKARKFVDICDAFHIPLAFFIDCPGFMVGPEIENKRMVSLAARLLNTMAGCTVPKATIVIRKAIGLAYLALGGRPMDPDVIVGWPTSHFDPMGPLAGVELVHARAIANSDDPDALRAELIEKAKKDADCYRAAELALIDDIIHPAETRTVIADMITRTAATRKTGFKHRIDP
ncbi:acyl-CoA carboxylase subunit beta [Oceanibacterium hippocampi]|uniref:Methylmalonyl-CoA carboxyltransferase 12S subunit n=1 Tax=Oceanibacterium hippocampi TaxID=745714 RepID=A0A1Y5TTZ4_9PROT|nr:carboxyl transferase domain-containing protein [Oceanibacterium hippocampi]SLN72646.1 Methylmalonyl-CoA carboxyltransferase 12S subunit [Oceanibacterium hippocampi]